MLILMVHIRPVDRVAAALWNEMNVFLQRSKAGGLVRYRHRDEISMWREIADEIS